MALTTVTEEILTYVWKELGQRLNTCRATNCALKHIFIRYVKNLYETVILKK